MTTGLHVVSDINCIACWSSCGWKYVRDVPSTSNHSG